MRRYVDKHNNFGTIWKATTRHFTIALELEQSFDAYDGDDDGSTQAALDAGEYVMFDSRVVVYLDNVELGADYLGASVYADGKTLDFMGDGYFRDMLKNACEAARDRMESMPRLRAA